MNIGWWIFTLLMGLPGFTEFYAAVKLFPFIRKEGGLFPFLICLFGGLFDLTFFFIMVAILLIGGNLQLEIPMENPIVFVIVVYFVGLFVTYRLMCVAMSLWLAGVLNEKWVRSLSKKRTKGRKRMKPNKNKK